MYVTRGSLFICFALTNEMRKCTENGGRVGVAGEGEGEGELLRVAARLIGKAPAGWADCVRWA